MSKIFETWMSQILIFAPVASGIFGAILFLIKIYTNDQKKIKELEVDTVLSNVKSLDQKIVDHKASIKSLTHVLQISREQLVEIRVRLDSSIKNEALFVKSIEDMKNATDKRLSHLESTLSDSEIVKLGTNRFMIKARTKKD